MGRKKLPKEKRLVTVSVRVSRAAKKAVKSNPDVVKEFCEKLV